MARQLLQPKKPLTVSEKCVRCGVGFRERDKRGGSPLSLEGDGRQLKDRTRVYYHPTCAIKEGCDLIAQSRTITKNQGGSFRV